MKSKNIQYKNTILTKKMFSVIIYGIIFIISTMAYFLVNFSKAEEVLKIAVNVNDSEAVLEEVVGEIEAIEEDGKYLFKLPIAQNGFVVRNYKVVEEIKKDTVEVENNVVEEDNKAKEENTSTNETTAKEYETLFEIAPEETFELNEEQLRNKKIYTIAEYDKKEVKDKENQIFYNKILLSEDNKNTISVSGYMPKEAELKVTEVEVQDVQNKILEKAKQDIKLDIAYDIKILVNDQEYEPYEFDEKTHVSITGVDNKSVNVWHLKDDGAVEKMATSQDDKTVLFDTVEYSIYGVEVVDEKEVKQENEEKVEIVEEKNTGDEKETKEETVVQDEPKTEEPGKVSKKGLLRAPASNAPDSTLEIDDYNSDYYYYKGKNYTDDFSGTYQGTYTDSNLVKVTLIYHGFAQGETNNEKKGRISLTETHDIVKNIRCVPVSGGNITVELMDNPFMDKPTGYGFGGWTTSLGNVTQDNKTLTYKLTAPASGNITVNLYAIWTAARVVYVNPEEGCDNLISRGYDGSTPEKPLGSWQAACNRLYSLAGNNTNRADRENNIIVVTGDMDSSINYTRPITGTLNQTLISADATYTNNNGISTNTSLIISNSNTAIGSTALSGNKSTITSTQVTSSLPAAGSRWTISGYNGNYSIRNEEGYYLTASDSENSTLSLSTTPFSSWSYGNNRLYYSKTVLGWFSITTYYFYLYLNNGNWTFYTRQTKTGDYGTRLYFYRYTTSNEVYEDDLSVTRGNMGNNSYYSDTRNLALTVTSLYNHTDYRNNAKITLNKSGTTYTTSADFNIYNDFQMNHVKISAEGYKSCTTPTLSKNYPVLIGNAFNVRIGRGMTTDGGDDSATFSGVIGGNKTVGSNSDDNNSYKLVVESGKYSGFLSYSTYGGTACSYYGTIYTILGSDIDRVGNNNKDLSVYYRTTVAAASGIIGKLNVRDKAYLINVKSGEFGIDYCVDNGISNFAGIYVGAYITGSASYHDISDRYCVVEGGLIAHLTGGLQTYSTNPDVLTRIYVKGGELYNMVGGAGVKQTYNDRVIQITGGKVRYSVSGGSNGNSASSDTANGKLEGNTLVYVGGNAQIGTETTLNETLFEVSAGCVLGAGNGTSNTTYNATSGQVKNSHIIINDSAHILNSVYGGGNYGIVGDSGATTAISKVEILGGTIDKNVYGGANQNNIYGSTTINVKGGQVKGAVYGGSNSSGTISTTSTINVTGGTLGQKTNTTANGVLFGGGYGTNTTVTGNAIVNILDTDGNVKIYGSAYGGSSLGRINADTIVKIQDLPSVANTIYIKGNVFAGGKGESGTAALIQGNSTLTVDGANITEASVFGGNDINGTTNGNITVNIGQNHNSKVLNVYGGGNEDDTGTEADTVKVYLLANADVTNAFNGGKSADLTTGGASDTTRAIYLQGGKATNIFGGSDTSGTVTASHVYIQSGTATNVYGGNNEGGETTESFVYVTNGNITNVYGGGYQATTPTTNVSLTGGTITNGYGGGNAADVTTANITLNGTTATSIYGGSNSSGTVNTSNVTITSGTVTNVYGGNNAGGNTVNTNVVVNSPATNVFGGGNQAETSGNTEVLLTSQVQNIYGGGNQAITKGNTNVKLTNATVTGNAYGGGNGSAAVVEGNSTIKVEGTTSIAGDLFGGGNAAANGTATNPNSAVTVLITGGTISGDVYGAANTSVVYGNTNVKVGSTAVNDSSLTQGNISISGTVFGGGKSNTAGSNNYDFNFESVTGDVHIDINATGYDNGTYTYVIGKSIFGSGNAAKISGDGYVTVTNYGSATNIKNNISIQRATKVILDNCHLYLEGTTDRTNEIATATYTFNRIDDLVLKNNTVIYLASGVNIVSKMESLDSNDVKEVVTIGDNGISNQTCDNRIYLSQGKNIVLRTEEGTHGEVKGMAFVGLFKEGTTREFGIYDTTQYTHGDTVTSQVDELFNRNSYVQGKHYTNHNIQVDGFYTNYAIDGVVKTRYIEPTPESADYYQWICGKLTTDIYYDDIELIATKYATTATHVLSLDGLSYPNTIIDVVAIDCSELRVQGIVLKNPSEISNIAATATEADTNFGLTMTAGNSGWQTKGTTYYTKDASGNTSVQGVKQYLSDNSTTTPTFSFYLAHSKNISITQVLGNVTIKLQATYVDNNGEMQIRDVYVVLKLSTNNTLTMGIDYYEGAITPGKEYSMFPTTTTTITKKSSFSAYYSLFINNYNGSKKYYDDYVGYYHILESTCVLPANTKITLVDLSGSSVKYYYYIVSSQDETNQKKVYKFADFIAMDSTNEPYSSDCGNRLNQAQTIQSPYYNSSQDLVYEEFIVQVDFEDTNITASLTSQNLLIKLLDAFDFGARFTVNTAQYPMIFSVYNNLDALSSVSLTTDKNVIYMGDSIDMTINSTYAFQKNNDGDTVYDTTHIEDQMGMRITISSGSDVLTDSDLQGIYISYNDINYFASSDGSYRMKIADAVSNVLSNMTLHTTNGQLDTGTYTITAQSFGSTDGVYFSTQIASATKNIQIVNTNYGFSVDMNENDVLIAHDTGKTKNDSNNLQFTLGYSGNFANPQITVSLYRRNYDDIYSYEYELVNLSDYVTNTLTSAGGNEYLVTNNVLATQNFVLTTKNTGLTTGTYKVRFSLYDGSTHIADMDKAVIIK